MNRTYIKWIELSALAILAVFTAAMLVIARPSPGTPVPTVSPEAASPEPAPPNPAMITWTPTSTEAIVSPGETKTISVSFVSSRNIRRASVEISPSLGQLISTEPKSFERIRKGEQKRLNIIVAPDANAALGTVSGTIQLRRGKVDNNDPDCDDDDRRDQGKLLPQALAVAVNVWQRVVDQSSGFSIRYPPDFTATVGSSEPESSNSQSGLVTSRIFTRPAGDAFEIYTLEVFQNPQALGIDAWLDAVKLSPYLSDVAKTTMTVGGVEGVQYASPAAGRLGVYVSKNGRIYALELPSYSPSDQDGTARFLDFVKTLELF